MLPGRNTHLAVDPLHLPDLTGMLALVRITRTGPFSVTYRCSYAREAQVAVKVIFCPPVLNFNEKNELVQRIRRERDIWKILKHPNIVPLLGTACGRCFGSDYPCLVSAWMPNEALLEYVTLHRSTLSISSRIKLIKGSVAGLEYLHSQGIVHGNVHPENILVDGDLNPHITGFELSHARRSVAEGSFLSTESIRPGAVLWAAPELLYPELYPELIYEVAPRSDIYSLGSVMLFILSGQFPWQSRGEAEPKLKGFQNPPRPVSAAKIPDAVWDFIGQCWSPRDPEERPPIRVVQSFSADRLERLLLQKH